MISVTKKWVVFIFSLLLISCAWYIDRSPNSTIQHVLVDNSFANLAWQKDHLMVFIDVGAPMVTAVTNRIVVLGIQPKNLYSFDSLTGDLSWEKRNASPNILGANNSTIYLTNLNKFEAYNGLDGSKDFEVVLPYSGLFTSISFDQDNVFIHSANGSFFMLNANGNVVRSMGPNTYPMPYIVNDITYAKNTNGLVASDTQTGELIWEAYIPDEGFYAGPYFSEDSIYVRTGSSTVPGKVYAIDKFNGAIRWISETDVISNVALLGKNIYFLSQNGYLIVLDKQTGLGVAKLEFSPRPFILPTAEWRLGGYYVASDPVNNIVVVSIGDSYQLFALKINSP